MTIKKIGISILMLFALGFLAACGGNDFATVPAVERTQFEEPPQNVRNYRYCEIIPIFRSGTTFRAEVYNTFGLNDCPTDLWEALDGEDLVEAYGAVDIRMNGPRYWVLDEVVGDELAAGGKIADFGGIEMFLPGIVDTQLREGSVGGELFSENEVQRDTTYIYYAGELVYELSAPDGSVYRMQSYAQIIDPDLGIDDLETLGDRLELPEGWSYESRVLDEESVMVADGLAFVVNDNLASSYQKVNP
ncbi:MAG: hypothetical protein AAGD96_30680 [Chloroflexota bacterium]